MVSGVVEGVKATPGMLWESLGQLGGFIFDGFGEEGSGSTQESGMVLTTKGNSPGNNNKSKKSATETMNMDELLQMTGMSIPSSKGSLYQKLGPIDDVLNAGESTVVTAKFLDATTTSISNTENIIESIESQGSSVIDSAVTVTQERGMKITSGYKSKKK